MSLKKILLGAAVAFVTVLAFNPVRAQAQVKDTYTGAAFENGKLGYYTNGQFDETATGLARFQGTWYYFENGAYTEATVLTQKLNNERDLNIYYVNNGQWDSKAAGIVEVSNKTELYYVKNGRVSCKTGIAQMYNSNNQNWYYVKDGIKTSAEGICRKIDVKDTNLYYVHNGVFTMTATGLTQKTDGDWINWFYVQDGVYTKAAGLTTKLNSEDESVYYIKNGRISAATTVAANADGTSPDTLIYVKKGVPQYGFTGDVKIAKIKYNVVDGVATVAN